MNTNEGGNARRHLEELCDKDSFCELFNNLYTIANDFPNYAEKLQIAIECSNETEAVICGTCTIMKQRCVIFIMESYFMKGSMGKTVGEKITRCFEFATEWNLPVVGICASGGVRVQEGLISLMQMAKIMCALQKHSNQGNLFISLLTNPTLGGVTASFAMNGDIILAEPGITVGFAGKRIVESVQREKLPSDFQKIERLFEKGYIDCIVERKQQKEKIGSLLKLHKKYK